MRQTQTKKTFESHMSQYLKDDMDRRTNQKRCFSQHVGSRWYRAPEIIMVEPQYDQSSDMWSMGVLMHELLQYTFREDPKDKEAFRQKQYLFKGTSCFPLSPSNKDEELLPSHAAQRISKMDQLLLIL